MCTLCLRSKNVSQTLRLWGKKKWSEQSAGRMLLFEVNAEIEIAVLSPPPKMGTAERSTLRHQTDGVERRRKAHRLLPTYDPDARVAPMPTCTGLGGCCSGGGAGEKRPLGRTRSNQDGVESTWANEDEARGSFTPLQLDVFHALRESYYGAGYRRRPPGTSTKGKGETAVREEALKTHPIGTKVRTEFTHPSRPAKGIHRRGARLQRSVLAGEVFRWRLGGVGHPRAKTRQGIGGNFSPNR